MNMSRTAFFDIGLCEVFVEVNSPVKLCTIEKSVDGFDVRVGRLNLQISKTKQSVMLAKTIVLLIAVHLIFNLVFVVFRFYNLLTINLIELGVWALLTHFFVGVSAKSLAIWLVLFFAVDGLFTVYGYGPWLSAEPPELLLWVLIAKRFTA
ncbi:MAG: hypothetical protein JO288_12270 [Hyphomicrobiales bacterium]|nr:hypothetical protein [Hyphomicrobiales bacterium]